MASIVHEFLTLNNFKMTSLLINGILEKKLILGMYHHITLIHLMFCRNCYITACLEFLPLERTDLVKTKQPVNGDS